MNSYRWTTSVSWSTNIYIRPLCVDIGCRQEDLPIAMTNTDRCRERKKERERGGEFVLLAHINDEWNESYELNTFYKILEAR